MDAVSIEPMKHYRIITRRDKFVVQVERHYLKPGLPETEVLWVDEKSKALNGGVLHHTLSEAEDFVAFLMEQDRLDAMPEKVVKEYP